MPPVARCHDDAEPRALKVRKINFSVRYVDACFKGIGITLTVYENGGCGACMHDELSSVQSHMLDLRAFRRIESTALQSGEDACLRAL